MLDNMMKASVGDDVFGEDPTVNKLEKICADMFGMEAAVFCPSGTMTNQIAIKTHTQPGDEVICEQLSHVYIYEGGGIAFNSGAQVKTIAGDRGRITAEQIEASINNPLDIHKAYSSLVSLENTTNRGGGACYDFNEILKIKEVCNKHQLKLHLDGARLWNALLVKNEQPKHYGEVFDSISICLSKGLGAPVGSVLLGNKEYIKKARRVRKVLGGCMRQSGYLAAAGIFAIEHNWQKLEKDHLHAETIAASLRKKKFIGEMLPVETNILIFTINDTYTPVEFANELEKQQILCMPISHNQVRMVTHLDVTENMIPIIVAAIEAL